MIQVGLGSFDPQPRKVLRINLQYCYKRVMADALFRDPSVLADFCNRNGIRRLSLFGSRLKGTERGDSDVDLLVEFDPDRIPGLLDIARMEFELSDMLGGLKVDLRTAKDLSRHFRDQVVQSAELLHAA